VIVHPVHNCNTLENQGTKLFGEEHVNGRQLVYTEGFCGQHMSIWLESAVIQEALLVSGVILNTCGPGEHVPVMERKIWTINKRVQGLLLAVPFERIPEIMLTQAVIFSVMWLIFFCPKEGVSTRISPQTIITGFMSDATKNCYIPFGGYAQIHVESTPSNDAIFSRIVGGICLGPTGNIQGTYKFLGLLTK
jgi:hypothetical protein